MHGRAKEEDPQHGHHGVAEAVVPPDVRRGTKKENIVAPKFGSIRCDEQDVGLSWIVQWELTVCTLVIISLNLTTGPGEMSLDGKDARCSGERLVAHDASRIVPPASSPLLWGFVSPPEPVCCMLKAGAMYGCSCGMGRRRRSGYLLGETV